MYDPINIEADLLPEQMLTEPPQHPDVRRRIRIQYRTLLNDVTSEWRLFIKLVIALICYNASVSHVDGVAWNFGYSYMTGLSPGIVLSAD